MLVGPAAAGGVSFAFPFNTLCRTFQDILERYPRSIGALAPRDRRVTPPQAVLPVLVGPVAVAGGFATFPFHKLDRHGPSQSPNPEFHARSGDTLVVNTIPGSGCRMSQAR